MVEDLTPKKIVVELDKYIIGQQPAKKAVAIALRNRYRRSLLDKKLKEEIYPKNILMIGPTGVGKTEIARRLAQLTQAPFLKIEATKYTEVGYVGRDVESMVRDLGEIAVRMVQKERMQEVKEKAGEIAVDIVLDILHPYTKKQPVASPFALLFSPSSAASSAPSTPPPVPTPAPTAANPENAENDLRAETRKQILAGKLDNQIIEIEVEEAPPSIIEVFSGSGMEEMGINFQDLLGGMFPKRKKTRKASLVEALKILALQEAEKMIDMEEVKRQAIERAEQHGIIFIDELDKIAGRESGKGPDVSREGVQRDILPIVEGSNVMSKYGPIRTDHILFVAAGAFNVAKPSDLIPELQGRFPIRVELTSLSQQDFQKILTEPEHSLTKQYRALMATESVELAFTPDGVEELAKTAQTVNEQTENIGARRLHTIMEKVLEEISFNAPELGGQKVIIDREYVKTSLQDILKSEDLSRFIL